MLIEMWAIDRPKPYAKNARKIPDAAVAKVARSCIGLEISPEYCDVIVKRWQDFTGQNATLEATGQTMEQVKFGRHLGAQDAIKEEVLEATHGKN